MNKDQIIFNLLEIVEQLCHVANSGHNRDVDTFEMIQKVEDMKLQFDEEWMK